MTATWTGAGYIDGRWTRSSSGATFASLDPATGTVVGTAADMTAADAADAVQAAHRAFGTWSRTTALERAAVLQRWAALMHEHEERLAALCTAEQGKPLAESVAEVRYAADFFAWFAGEAPRAYGRVIPSNAPDARLFTVKRPSGVAAVLTPWNFPYAMITRKLGAALAAGCTAVVKPAQDTPLCALALAELGQAAGVPAGVVNVVPCLDPAAVGRVLCEHPLVRVLSFTGSTAVGRALLAASAPTVTRVAMELGGNAPVIVFDDAELDAAVRGTMASKFRNAGQTCVCVNRVLVARRVVDDFCERLDAAIAGLVVGRGDAPGTTIGPLVNDAAAAKVDALVRDAQAGGARVVRGGGPHPLGRSWYAPTLLRGVDPQLAIARTEVFGPVATVIEFDGEEQAVTMANDTRNGLAAYAYTQDAARVWRLAEDLDFGIIGINDTAISTPVAPFGGTKEAGLGREGGSEGIDEYLDTHAVRLGIGAR